MAALYTQRPNWPTNPRVSRQSTFFNNEGWQLRSGTELSGLDDATSFSTLIADPGHLTDFITAPDGIKPTGFTTYSTVFQRLLSWVGFTDENGKEIPIGYTRSIADGGSINIDMVFVTDITFTGIPNLFVGVIGIGTDTEIRFRDVSPNVITSFPTPNIIRFTINLVLDAGTGSFSEGIDTPGIYRLFPGTSTTPRLFINSTTITTVADTGHTAVELLPSSISGLVVEFPSEAIENAQTLTIVA